MFSFENKPSDIILHHFVYVSRHPYLSSLSVAAGVSLINSFQPSSSLVISSSTGNGVGTHNFPELYFCTQNVFS